MKKYFYVILVILVFAFLIALAQPAHGQTKTELTTQTKTSVVGTSVVLALPNNGGFITALLDSNTLELVNDSNGILVLKAKPAALTFQEDFFKTTSPQSSFTTTKKVSGGKGAVFVFMNGLLQREIEDYAAQENVGVWTFTFNIQVPTGTFITIRYPTN